MIIEVTKNDLITLIMGVERYKVDIELLKKLKDKYPEVIDIGIIESSKESIIMIYREKLTKLNNKQLLEIYNNYLGGSITLIQ